LGTLHHVKLRQLRYHLLRDRRLEGQGRKRERERERDRDRDRDREREREIRARTRACVLVGTREGC
jgi:hypothetical protein